MMVGGCPKARSFLSQAVLWHLLERAAEDGSLSMAPLAGQGKEKKHEADSRPRENSAVFAPIPWHPSWAMSSFCSQEKILAVSAGMREVRQPVQVAVAWQQLLLEWVS